jgi:hypothetical protein
MPGNLSNTLPKLIATEMSGSGVFGSRKSRGSARTFTKPARFILSRMKAGLKAISSGSSRVTRRNSGILKIRKMYGLIRFGSQKISRPPPG